MPAMLHLTFFFFGETEKPFIQKSQHRHSSKRDIAVCLLGAQATLNVNAPCLLLKKGFGAKFDVDLSAS